MRCFTARRWLGRYQDGELAVARRSPLEDHLAGCPACAAELARQRTVWAELEVLADVPPLPPELWRRVQSGLGQRETGWSSMRWWLDRRLTVGAALAFGTVVGLMCGALLSLAVTAGSPSTGHHGPDQVAPEAALVAEAFQTDGLGWLVGGSQPPHPGGAR